jgi:Uma2 family endonuclease
MYVPSDDPYTPLHRPPLASTKETGFAATPQNSFRTIHSTRASLQLIGGMRTGTQIDIWASLVANDRVATVKTVVLSPLSPDFEAILARRHALGQDLFDEIWEGTYHVVAAPHPWHGYLEITLGELLGPLARAAQLVGTGPFNLGQRDDYRVPDLGYHRGLPSDVWVPTAALVVEVVSPDGETWEKFGFYARHAVDEICIADPVAAELKWFSLESNDYRQTSSSNLLNVTVVDLASQIAWPH